MQTIVQGTTSHPHYILNNNNVILIHRHGACTSHACDFLEKDFAEYEYYLPSHCKQDRHKGKVFMHELHSREWRKDRLAGRERKRQGTVAERNKDRLCN
jgi:hypothetical protein